MCEFSLGVGSCQEVKKNLNLDFVSTPTPKPRASQRIWGSTQLLSRCTSHQETLRVYSSQERMCGSPFVIKVLVWGSPWAKPHIMGNIPWLLCVRARVCMSVCVCVCVCVCVYAFLFMRKVSTGKSQGFCCSMFQKAGLPITADEHE